MSFADAQAHQERVAQGRAGAVEFQPEGLSQADEKEEDLKAKCLNYCRACGWLVFSGSAAHKSKRTEGEPDLTVLADRGRVFWIELKVFSRKQRPAQVAVEHHMRKLGHNYSLARSFDEFLAIVNQPSNLCPP